jgi:T5SS/PEP-CTERM-associated repeat protein
MFNTFNRPHRMRSFVRWAQAFCLCFMALSLALTARADVVSVGDVTPVPSDAGGNVGGVLIIGDTDVGGLFMDIAPPLSGTLMPLQSTDGIIGNGVNSIGAADFNDFGVRWEIGTSLSVGLEGQGFLNVFESALIQVGGPLPTLTGITILGDLPAGQGVINLNGLASRLTTSDLTVGELGVGTITANQGASFVSSNSMIGNLAGSIGTVSLTDLGTRWDLRGALQVGNAAATSLGFLNIDNEALLQADALASVVVNPTGQVNLDGGTIRQILTGPAVVNNGVIRGDGLIDAGITIGASGELRNKAAIANEREYLLVSGPVTVAGNSDGFYDTGDGLIESQGGEMEFLDTVTNAGVIVARDAIMRFRGMDASGAANDLVNNGLVVLGENTTIYGNISTVTGSVIDDVTNAGAVTTIFGDVTFSQVPLVAALTEGGLAAMSAPASSLKLIIDDDPGALSIFGDLTLSSDTLFELDFATGASSQQGDSFQVLSANSISGTFANTQTIANGRYWDINVMNNEIFVTAGALVSTIPGDFDHDFDVDGDDFLLWQRDPSIGNLADWENNYGAPPLAAASAPTAVPEPTALMLALSALAWGRRRRVS